ncbi:hypothetical protein ES703_80073 [subsurface metagenome]
MIFYLDPVYSNKYNRANDLQMKLILINLVPP